MVAIGAWCYVKSCMARYSLGEETHACSGLHHVAGVTTEAYRLRAKLRTTNERTVTMHASCTAVLCCVDFCAQVRLVEGAYVQLEDAYCLRSVEEAMRIAEPIEVCMYVCMCELQQNNFPVLKVFFSFFFSRCFLFRIPSVLLLFGSV